MLITDHQALQYGFKKKGVHGRLAGWMDFLAEYEFDIKYRPGAKNGVADFLPRVERGDIGPSPYEDEGDLVCSVHSFAHTGTEEIEPYLTDILRYLQGLDMEERDTKNRCRLRREAKRFLVWQGEVFLRSSNRLKLAPTFQPRLKIMKGLHDEIGHWDVTATKQLVSDPFWWPSAHSDIHDYMKS